MAEISRKLRDVRDCGGTRLSPQSISAFVRMRPHPGAVYGEAMIRRSIPFLLALMGVLRVAEAAEPKEIVTRSFRPEQRPFSMDKLALLKAPAGFKVSVFAQQLGNARMMLT